ncbi:13440_t:CDS:2 [Acaulospora morrowiae]|uniref:13440_t:CDS:1 n=1 Tax=Acaulospora morrowiae TaxID=94023 RepID=A0A9N9HR45_9GLOM|nr:13440_t:CDS:2 [Acaulospora morrowiae]
MSSELEVLKQRITELEAKNAKLEDEIPDLRNKLSVFDAEIAKLKRRNVEALRANEENNERRDAKVKKLEASNNNAVIKLSEDKKPDSFLDEVHKEKVTNENRQRNREKKLLRESSTKDLSGDVFTKVNPTPSDVFDFTMDRSEKKQPEGASHMTEISLTGCEENNDQEKIESQEGLAELSSSDVLQNINRLFENACIAENERLKANQAEILCWRNFNIGLDNSIDEIMIKEKVGTKKAKGLIYDFILAHILTPNEKLISTHQFNTELPGDQDDSIIDSEEEISDDQTIASEVVSAEVNISTTPIPLTNVSNSSGSVNTPCLSSSREKEIKINVPPKFEESIPTMPNNYDETAKWGEINDWSTPYEDEYRGY